jgi:hypothetical protein
MATPARSSKKPPQPVRWPEEQWARSRGRWLGGAAAGAAAGGVLGALIALGIPEDEARRHEQEFLAGHTLVVVQALGRGAEALAILDRSWHVLK